MKHDVVFADSFEEDLSSLAAYEMQFTLSLDAVFEHFDAIVDEVACALELLPERYPEKTSGFTSAKRRKYTIGKYAAFYQVDEAARIVRVERLLHSKANFERIHFGN
ncbi:type II toxin-antitoxin system RelE/ParE family toxin [Rubneribacter sp.]|nr:type II toxin-antitoxin system RelE/ParE family toxin [Candidatus Rubneribacter avistercoris]